jgi:hypothetical protein
VSDDHLECLPIQEYPDAVRFAIEADSPRSNVFLAEQTKKPFLMALLRALSAWPT